MTSKTELEKIYRMISDACYAHLTEHGIQIKLPKIMEAINQAISREVKAGQIKELKRIAWDEDLSDGVKDDLWRGYTSDRLAELEGGS